MSLRSPSLGLIALVLCLFVREASSAEKGSVERDEQTLREGKIATTGPALLEFFRKRTVKDANAAQLKVLINQLGDDSFEQREKASMQLITLGMTAIPFLKEALKNPDIEIVRRAEDCLKRIVEGTSGSLVDAAARVLMLRKPHEAIEVLLGYLPFAEDEIAADQVRDAINTLAVRDGKPEPALLAALTDKIAVRRSAAAVALVKSGLADPRPAVQKLLQDSDFSTRVRVGLALADTGEKKAIPVLIDLLTELPPDRIGLIKDTLYRLAGDQGPLVVNGNDAANRRKYRDAWADWWSKNEGKVDLAKLHQVTKQLGYTIVVFLDAGKIQELNEKKEKRWEIDGLQFPLDIQYLPGDRVLIAEQAGNRVTERNLKGEIVWQKLVLDPLVAQRLPGGNTFIANRSQLMEVDKNGKEVFRYIPANGDQVMRAQRLPNEDIAVVLSSPEGNVSRFVRLSPDGTSELQTFPVDVHTYGGRIEQLPNRHLVVPQMNNNKVVEHDARGKIVWEATVEKPIAVLRLPSGNTLATSMSQQRALELDKNGKEVWEFKGDTRVTRHWRR